MPGSPTAYPQVSSEVRTLGSESELAHMGRTKQSCEYKKELREN